MTNTTNSRNRKSARGRTADGAPNPIDVHVGNRMRLRRTLLGMSQDKLAGALGLTFQQVQKYERGANRVGCSRLYDLSRVLDVPVSFFFDDMGEDVAAASPAAIAGGASGAVVDTDDPATKRESLELMRAYYKVPEDQRAAVRKLLQSMAASNDGAVA